MIQFSHSQLNKGKPFVLRLGPTRVNWTYQLNTNIIDTYGGQIVQVLSINYDKLIIEGQFGREGPHGKRLYNHSSGKKEWRDTPKEELWNYENVTDLYGLGLTQMTAYFQDYFAIASQGGDTRKPGLHYVQEPMKVSYTGGLDDRNFDAGGEREWTVYPVSFPSYSRSIKEFAPKWKIEFEIEETKDYKLTRTTLEKHLKAIRQEIGFEHYWQFSDPVRMWAGNPDGLEALVAAEARYRQYLLEKFDFSLEFLPTMTTEEFTDLLLTGASVPEILKRAESTFDGSEDTDSPIRTDPSKPPDNGGGGGGRQIPQ